MHLLFYTFGYSMGESFLFNQRFLYWQNLHIGDPLATPYAKRPAVEITADTSAIVVKATHDHGIARIDLYNAGQRIAQNTGAGELQLPSPGQAGDSLDLLAVAVANNVQVARVGWPEPDQLPKPDVQGWTAAKWSSRIPQRLRAAAGRGARVDRPARQARAGRAA